MEKFFLGCLLSRDELNIIDHEHVNIAILLTQRQGLVVTNRVDDFVCEFLRRDIAQPNTPVVRLDAVPNGLHQVSFAEPDAAVNEQWVVDA